MLKTYKLTNITEWGHPKFIVPVELQNSDKLIDNCLLFLNGRLIHDDGFNYILEGNTLTIFDYKKDDLDEAVCVVFDFKERKNNNA